MRPEAILVGQFVAVVFLVLAAWIVGTRALRTRWSSIGWGALAFPLSQVLRFGLLTALTVALAPIGRDSPAPSWVPLLNTTILVLTSGLFEESTRWLVLRFWARRDRAWADGVTFGLGHGGIEALLIFGSSLVGGLVLLAGGDAILAQVRAADPGQAAVVQGQIDALRALAPGLAALGVYERVLAMALHVACTVMVLRAARERRWGWWALAVVTHCGLNALAVAVNSAGPPWLTEAALTVPVLVLLWAVVAGPLGRRAVEAVPVVPPTSAGVGGVVAPGVVQPAQHEDGQDRREEEVADPEVRPDRRVGEQVRSHEAERPHGEHPGQLDKAQDPHRLPRPRVSPTQQQDESDDVDRRRDR